MSSLADEKKKQTLQWSRIRTNKSIIYLHSMNNKSKPKNPYTNLIL